MTRIDFEVTHNRLPPLYWKIKIKIYQVINEKEITKFIYNYFTGKLREFYFTNGS